MNEATFLPALAGGVLSGGSLLLVVLGVALLYEHGRYIPLWLPDLGMLGAYMVHAVWAAGLPAPLAFLIGLVACAVLAWVIHRVLIARFLEARDYLSPMLIGLGLAQIFQGVAALYGEGMSQHYPDAFLAQPAFSAALGVAVHWVDVAFFVMTAAGLMALHAFLHCTHLGLQVRAVVANPDWARSLDLPCRAVDAAITTAATILVCTGTVMRGFRYDLQPGMMFYPGLEAIVACIVAGPRHRVTALLVALILEILVSLVGTDPAFSPLQRAAPFAVFVVVVLARSFFGRSELARPDET